MSLSAMTVSAMTVSASVRPWSISICLPAVRSGLLTGLLSLGMMTGAAVAQETAATAPGVSSRADAGVSSGANAGENSGASNDLFLPPPDVAELNQITKTAIAPLSQRKTQRSLVIRLAQRRVYVYENDNLMVSYPVAIGKDGWETPRGQWKVDQMLREPSWQHPWTGEIVPPGPDNPLGRRWIGFWNDGVNAIGFHGTPNENLVGQAVSHGCVRMKNAHIEAMFQQIAMGATVRVE